MEHLVDEDVVEAFLFLWDYVTAATGQGILEMFSGFFK